VRRSLRRRDNKNKKGGGTYGCLQIVEEKGSLFCGTLSDFVEKKKKLWLFVGVFGNDSDIFILIFLPGTESKNDATSFRDDVLSIMFYSLEMIKNHTCYICIIRNLRYD